MHDLIPVSILLQQGTEGEQLDNDVHKVMICGENRVR